MFRALIAFVLLAISLVVEAEQSLYIDLHRMVDFGENYDTLIVEPFYDVGSHDEQYLVFKEMVHEPVIGADLYNSSGAKVASFQNIYNLQPSTVLFSQAFFFVTSNPFALYSALDEGQSPIDCAFMECTWHDIVIERAVYNAYVTASLSTTPVPEPEIYAMMLMGLGIIGGRLRRRLPK